MRLPPFDVFEPRTVKDALAVMRDYKGSLKVVSGGTELLGLMKLRLAAPDFLLSTGRIGALKGIEEKKREIVINAGTTLYEIAHSPLLADRFRSIAGAAGLVAAYPIQTRATVGGNILQNTRCLHYNQSELVRKGLPACFKAGGNVCNAVKGSRRCFSVYQGDMAPALMSFGAAVELKKQDGSRRIPLSELYTGKGRSPLAVEPDELLTRIFIPVPKGAYGSWYEKLRLRKALDYPLASSAAFVSMGRDNKIDTIRVVLGAAGPGPLVLDGSGDLNKEGILDEKAIDRISGKAFTLSRTVDNLGLPGSYRRKMIRVVTARALRSAIGELEKEGRS